MDLLQTPMETLPVVRYLLATEMAVAILRLAVGIALRILAMETSFVNSLTETLEKKGLLILKYKVVRFKRKVFATRIVPMAMIILPQIKVTYA